ncbi:MAG TPA: Ger(x)C family spore germination protein [Terriglobales bacterium]|nr:Ger(x)C family spore germination protein [Terriglobales bacterium]
MRPYSLRRTVVILPLAAMLAAALSGCWDSKEIEEQFILTAVSIDTSDIPGKIRVTAQVADIKQGEFGSGEAGQSAADSVIVMAATGDTLMGSLSQIDRNSSHKLLFHHNQIRLFGIDLARQGIDKHLDMILRDQKARLEVPLAVVDGRAEEILTAKFSEMPISGVLLGSLFQDRAGISVEYRVRLIDYLNRRLDDAAAPVIPIVKAEGDEGEQEIRVVGMAVFDGGAMIGRLSIDETLGYVFTFGNVKRCNMEVIDISDRAGLHISTLSCKRKIALRKDGGIQVTLKINADADLGEVYGFKNMKPPELLKRLEVLAQEEIKAKIERTFSAAKALDSDIFGFCTMVYKKYPKEWAEMKDRWDEIFEDIDLKVEVRVNIPETGQIVPSLEMEKNMQ